MCIYDPVNIELSKRVLTTEDLEDVEFLRFRKQVSAKSSDPSATRHFDSAALSTAKENTVFVVNVNGLANFLRYFDVIDEIAIRRLLRDR